MIAHPRIVVLVASLVLAVSAPRARAADPAYPDTTAGLQKLIEDAIAAVKAGESDKATAMAKAMILPNHEAWFKKTFGDDMGGKLAEDYTKMGPTLETALPKLLAARIKDGRTFASAVKIESADDKEATGAQRKAIESMKEKVPLYTVRLGKAPGESGFTLWSFAFVDGQFRLIGKTQLRPAA
jgi:hypothetical protein